MPTAMHLAPGRNAPPVPTTTSTSTHPHAPTAHTSQGTGHAIAGVCTPERQAAIENALSAALHYLRKPGDSTIHLHVATARATRAASLLKQACEDAASTAAGLRAAQGASAQRGV